MRSDDLKRAPQSQEAAKADAARLDAAKGNVPESPNADSDAATISDLANALNPSDARIEALRLQVERGEYLVSAHDVAGSMIDEHITDEHRCVENQNPPLNTRNSGHPIPATPSPPPQLGESLSTPQTL